jgi:hypothetical protein
MSLFEMLSLYKLLSLYIPYMFYNIKKFFRGWGEGSYFRGGAYFPDSLASVEKGAYFRGALTFETL